MKTALISVYDKEGIVDFVRQLVELGLEDIIASKGTAEVLREAGIDVRDVASLVGGGPILRHRVVTLSREIHAGLLAKDTKEDREELKGLGIPWIDLVCVGLYPLREEIENPDSTRESVIEKTDIGGPAILRSAAKGRRIVICDLDDRERVIDWLREGEPGKEHMISMLAAKAEAIVSDYCLNSARFHSGGEFNGAVGRQVLKLAYGENRDQSPASLYSASTDDPLAWDKFKIVSGTPGFINMADGDRALQVLCLMAESFGQNLRGSVPHIAIACKHGNPCGAAIDWVNPVIALNNALLGDHIAVMGAEVMTNFEITQELARALYLVSEEYQAKVGRKFWGIDVVFAPGFDDGAIQLLGKKERRRLMINPALVNPVMSSNEWVVRPVRGGFLRQKAPWFVFSYNSGEEWTSTSTPLGEDDFDTLILAWATTWGADSNTVMIAKDGMLIGSGVGQKDRTGCCNLALWYVKRAGHDTKGSVFASDAFFPYAQRKRKEDPLEGPELLAQAGCIGGIVPADGKNLTEVKEFFNSHNMAVAFLPKEHRGFSQH